MSHEHSFQPGDQGRMLHWFQDLSFDGDGGEEDEIYVCTFDAGDVVDVVHSDAVALNDAVLGTNVTFIAIRGRDRCGKFRTVILEADNLAPAHLN
jgi:hypothetical protein